MSPFVEPLLQAAPETFARAVRAGAAAPGVGTAFLAGYRQAIAALVPSLGPPSLPSLAATESGPLHPREVRTALVDGRVSGQKRYVTGAPGSDRAVVLAGAGQEGDRLRLVAVIVDLGGPGVTLRPMPPPPFVPDVPHAEIDLDGAPALDVLPGDGWAAVVRPFRTAEDVHVLGAVVGYLSGVALRSSWPQEPVIGLTAVLAGLVALSSCDRDAPGTHLALAGVLAQLRALLPSLPWQSADPDEASRWLRDRELLAVAERARAARLAAAWERVRPVRV
jgi:acyl-CoA dehydrogenase